jgi:hypothetical protein
MGVCIVEYRGNRIGIWRNGKKLTFALSYILAVKKTLLKAILARFDDHVSLARRLHLDGEAWSFGPLLCSSRHGVPSPLEQVLHAQS